MVLVVRRCGSWARVRGEALRYCLLSSCSCIFRFMNTKTPIKPLSRAQAKQALEQMPLDALLGSGVSRELTPKQRKFARAVAAGATKADAYRGAYNVKSKSTMTSKPYALARDDRVKAEIEAFKLAQAAQEYRTPAALRALVIQTLCEVVTNPMEKGAVRVNAAKVLGTVQEVAAFRELKEVRTISSSEDARAKIMQELKTLMLNSGDTVDIEANSLIDELSNPAESPDSRVGTDDDNTMVFDQADSGVDSVEGDAVEGASADGVEGVGVLGSDGVVGDSVDPTTPRPPSFG